MGYGEFGGGGSVVWEVKHGDGDSGSGSKSGGKGKDKHPKTDTGIFTVMIEKDGVLVFQDTLPLLNGKVKVFWTDPSVTPGGVRGLSPAGVRRSTKKASPKGSRSVKR